MYGKWPPPPRPPPAPVQDKPYFAVSAFARHPLFCFFGWTEKTFITKRLSQLCVELQHVLKQENRPKQPTITVPKKEVLLILPYLEIQ